MSQTKEDTFHFNVVLGILVVGFLVMVFTISMMLASENLSDNDFHRAVGGAFVGVTMLLVGIVGLIILFHDEVEVAFNKLDKSSGSDDDDKSDNS